MTAPTTTTAVTVTVTATEVADDDLRVSRGLVIPTDELNWRFTASGGPGGQHANTSNTRAEVRFDIAGSPTLGPRQRARLLGRFGSEIRVAASDERSQTRTRSLALQRLRDKLAEALHVERTRTATKPTRGSQRRRVEAKKQRSQTKAQRLRPSAED